MSKKNKESLWLDRSLVISPYYYRLCLTEKEFHKELKRLGIPKDQWPEWVSEGYGGTAHMFTSKYDDNACIVCIRLDKDYKIHEVNGLIVHEAVHLWQAIKRELNEKEPSPEFEAYSIQAIAQRLMGSYQDQKSKKRSNKCKL